MKLLARFVILLILAALSTAPAFASTVLYTNGPISGNLNAWPFGIPSFAVGDSFVLSGAATVSSFDAGVWVLSGDSPTTLTWEILTGGPDFMGGTVVSSGSATWSNVFFGSFSRFDIYSSTVNGLSVTLGAGTYWLELLNGQTAQSQPVYWDQNFGPSLANINANGNQRIPSESFTIYGSSNGSTPEPGSLIMFGSGIIGLAGVLRRKIYP